jgi:hypothetical protein
MGGFQSDGGKAVKQYPQERYVFFRIHFYKGRVYVLFMTPLLPCYRISRQVDSFLMKKGKMQFFPRYKLPVGLCGTDTSGTLTQGNDLPGWYQEIPFCFHRPIHPCT